MVSMPEAPGAPASAFQVVLAARPIGETDEARLALLGDMDMVAGIGAAHVERRAGALHLAHPEAGEEFLHQVEIGGREPPIGDVLYLDPCHCGRPFPAEDCIPCRRQATPVINRDRHRNGASHRNSLPRMPETGSLRAQPMLSAMARGAQWTVQTPTPGDPQPGPHSGRRTRRARSTRPYVSFWLRELPYVVVLILTLFGVAYASFSRQSMVGYWEFLAPVIGILCVVIGWPHAHDKAARLAARLDPGAALAGAFLVAMNLLLLSGVASLLSPDAIGLTILTLLALGTFVAGVHIQAWQICVLGMVMGLGVPAIAWIERSALLLLLLAVVALAAIGAALWWGARGKRA